MMRDETVVVLGATSRIARDFILNAYRMHGLNFSLFARRADTVRDFLKANDLPDHWVVGGLRDFAMMSASIGDAKGIVNFVGIGDPAKATEMGAGIFDATMDSDNLARRFVADRPLTPYIFFSSGAVYGTGFAAPADANTPSVIPVNALEPHHFYTVSKLHAEAVHRGCFGSTILDLRIFNYLSRSIDLSARFLITDMLRCVVEGTTFITTSSAMTRDYIHPEDLLALLMSLLSAPRGTNLPIDAYSAAPITKKDLVELLAREFALKFEIRPSVETINATGAKPEYYSTNRTASKFGYKPRYTSAESVALEARAILARMQSA